MFCLTGRITLFVIARVHVWRADDAPGFRVLVPEVRFHHFLSACERARVCFNEGNVFSSGASKGGQIFRRHRVGVEWTRLIIRWCSVSVMNLLQRVCV